MSDTTQTISSLSYAVRQQYIPDYIRGAQAPRLYDAYAENGAIPKEYVKGSTINVNFLSELPPATTAIPEDSDVQATSLVDAQASMGWSSRWNLLRYTEKLMTQSYTKYGAEAYYAIGQNMMESVDLIARDQATQGALVQRKVARASLAGGTSTHLLALSNFIDAGADMQTLKVPSFVDADRSMWLATFHPYALADLLNDTKIVAVAEYQKANILFKNEIGELDRFKLNVSPWAKMFWGAGADNTTATIATTLNGAVVELAESIVVADATGMVVGGWLTIGTEETAGTHYATNERVVVTAISGTTISIAGEGSNGGVKYAHATASAVRNANSVCPVTFGGPQSLAKVYAQDMETNLGDYVGEYGTIVGPNPEGHLKQFVELGWKYYGNYSRIIETRLYRREVAISRDAGQA
ncbi:MAG: N4-gp56 family major capsid protein [Chloroflexi bacterium]|nr:MAG: N4-gp56 family major capsid protein [Chloroflexota bacterium]